MSQSRSRKAPAMAGPVRARTAQAKASGDTAILQKPQHDPRSKSKSRIPKNMRDELENALVGLCDVWFEDIKPHLMRNNIKVHIHGGAGAGDVRERLPTGAAGCSHLDPGAALDRPQRRIVSSAGCYSTQPTASRAPSRKPLSPPCQFQQTLPRPQQALRTQQSLTIRIPCFDGGDKRSSRKVTPRRKTTPFNWKVPRLCLASSLPIHSQVRNGRTSLKTRNLRSQTPTHNFPESHVSKKSPSKNKIMKNKSTQTEPEYLAELGWQQSSSLGRPKHGFTNFYPSQRKKSKLRKDKPLFQDDLIDIIGDKHDKRVKVLYRSPRTEEQPSVMYLVQSPQKIGTDKKTTPWR